MPLPHRPMLVAAMLAGCFLAAGCAREPDLVRFGGLGTGPDEFAIVPSKPLETPADLRTLPPPAPGAGNRADATPMQDAVVALGGRPDRLQRDAASPDTALVAHAGRFGTDPSIRATLAAEDLEFRRRNGGLLLERAFNRNRYFTIYSGQQLDQQRERARLSRAGVPTPESPPPVPAGP